MEDETTPNKDISYIKKDHLKNLEHLIPSMHKRKADAFLKLLQLLESPQSSDELWFKEALSNLKNTIPEDEKKDFKFLAKEFIETMQHVDLVVQRLKVPIFKYLISNNLLNKNKFDDPSYLRLAIQKYLPKEFFENLNIITKFDQDFIEIVEYAFSVDKPIVAIALFAVSIEHKINSFYRDILICKGLNHNEITQALRNSNIHVKLGWLLSLSSSLKLDSDSKTDLLRLFDFRNFIVHYKSIPEPIDESDYLGCKEKINEFSIDRLKELAGVLEHYFDEIRKQEIPNYKKAVELAEKAYGAHLPFQDVSFDP